jgi:hypothetical protein
MEAFPLRSDTERYVLLIEASAEVYDERLDGSQKGRFDNQTDKFLEEQTPESGLQDADKFPTPLRQLKDRGGQVRGLGTWCKGDDFDLFVTQIICPKSKENSYLPYKEKFSNEGKQYKDRFESMNLNQIKEKAVEWRQRDDLILFQSM